MPITQYKDHPLSEHLPLMPDDELQDLADDIRQNTQRAPITLYEGKILDGRNRYRACKIANVEPKVRVFTSGNAWAFVLSVNVFRRHLTTSQRALIAARMVNGNSSAILQSAPATSVAAKELKVSPRTVETAKEVLREAPAREIKKIEQGKKTVATVARETKAKAVAKEIHLDKTGYAIPETVWADWQRAEEFQSALSQITNIKSQVVNGIKDDVIFAEVTNTTVATLSNAYGDLKRVLPYAVCTSCQGRTPKKCTLCKGRGFISRFTYDTCVPMATKKIRERAAAKK